MELTELEAAGLKAALYGPPADRVWLYVHGKGGCKEEAEDFAALACPRGWQVLAADLPEHGTRRGDGVPLDPWHAGARAAGAVGLCQRAVAAYRPAVHQSGGLVLPAGLRRGASGAGAFRLPGGGHGGAHSGHDGVGRRQRGPTGGGRRAGHSLRGDPLLALPPVCPRPSGVPLAHSHRPAVRLRGRHAPPDGGRGLRRRFGGALTVLEGGEHWFHTPEQLAALHRWESDVLEQMK